MEEIDNELETKSIERDEVNIEVEEVVPEPEPPIVPKKSKKVRSAAQIAAFEKAKIKRQENIKLKKEQKAQEKENKKNLKLKFKEELNSSKAIEPRSKTPPLVRPKPSVQEKPIQSSNPREQVIQNHYYYYGVPPPQQESHYTKSDKKKKKKKPIMESSSSEEEEEHPVFSPPPRAPSPADEPQSYKDLQNYQEPNPVPQSRPKPTLKFSYA